MDTGGIEKKVKEFMAKYQMTVQGGRILTGLSGGADSVCLLHVLNNLKRDMGFELRALHVHHGLRGEEADRDADYSEALCCQLGLQCRVVRIDAAAEAELAGISVEEAGREARYRLLEKEALLWEQEEPGEQVRIAMAHHGNDSAETILHNLFRGSGLTGLGGIPPVRGRIIRPLLWIGRAEILRYLKENSVSFVEDSSNKECGYTRNRLRNEILPLITEKINSKAVQNILRAGGWIREADACFERMAEKWLDCNAVIAKNLISLPASKLLGEERILQGYILRRALLRAAIPLKDITAAHVEEVLTLAAGGTGKQNILPAGLRAVKEYAQLKLWVESGKTNLAADGVDISAHITAEPWELRPEAVLGGLRFRVFPYENGTDISKNQCTKWFDYDKIKDTLSVRRRRTGDYIMLRSGGKKTVKTFMIDEKIPRDRRDEILLLTEGNHALWIVGYRISEYYKVTEETKTILEVHLDGGTDSG